MRVQIGDIRLFFDIEGAKFVPDGSIMRERPTVILLHGGPGEDHAGLKPFGSKLVDLAQVVYIDHRGCGRSDWSVPKTWHLEKWADDLRAFCDALEIQRPIVIGNSFGGYVALSYATRYPEHPSKLILAGSAARFRLNRALAVFERLGGVRAADVARRFFADPMPNFAEYIRVCLPLYWLAPLAEEPLSQASPSEESPGWSILNLEVGGYFVAGEMQTFDLLADLGRIKCPTMVLSGALDPIATVEDIKELIAALPRDSFRLELFAELGHDVLGDAALPAVREFIASP